MSGGYLEKMLQEIVELTELEHHLAVLIKDPAVVREVHWEACQTLDGSHVSLRETKAVLEALDRVLKGGETEDGGKSRGDTNGEEDRS